MKNNILRGKILEFLHHIYPTGADSATLNSVLYQYHRVDDIEESAEYLAEKGYVSKTEGPHPYKLREKVVLYKIAPKGIDLLEGNLDSDPGITIPVEA